MPKDIKERDDAEWHAGDNRDADDGNCVRLFGRRCSGLSYLNNNEEDRTPAACPWICAFDNKALAVSSLLEPTELGA